MHPQDPTVRPAAVAGLFYPAGTERLRRHVSDLLAGVGVSDEAPPKALIVPHAGYPYSGRVAAAAFATLRQAGPAITRVVLIGPAHHLPFRGIAIPTADAFETPLGRVRVDAEGCKAISTLRSVVAADAPHAPEHALEVELPFLQTILTDFALVPLLVGDAGPQEVAQVLRELWGERETLIVVSSDLSHYHDYETARRLDATTAAAIETGDWAALGPDQACGCTGVAGLVLEARRRGLQARRLAL